MPLAIHIEEHPLYPEIKRLRLKLWQIRHALGGSPSETILSRTLRGIDPMPKELEQQIQCIVDQVKQDQQRQTVNE
jgi:hypothetical protein